jgi:hypothetical protein
MSLGKSTPWEHAQRMGTLRVAAALRVRQSIRRDELDSVKVVRARGPDRDPDQETDSAVRAAGV